MDGTVGLELPATGDATEAGEPADVRCGSRLGDAVALGAVEFCAVVFCAVVLTPTAVLGRVGELDGASTRCVAAMLGGAAEAGVGVEFRWGLADSIGRGWAVGVAGLTGATD